MIFPHFLLEQWTFFPILFLYRKSTESVLSLLWFVLILPLLSDWVHWQAAAGQWGCSVGFQQMLAEITGKLQLSEAATELSMLLWPVGFPFWMRPLCVLLPVGTWTSPAIWCESWLHQVALVSLVRLNESVHAIGHNSYWGKKKIIYFLLNFLKFIIS